METHPLAGQLAGFPTRAIALILARCSRRLQPLFVPASELTPDNTNPSAVAAAMAQRVYALESFAEGGDFAEPPSVDKVVGGSTVYAWTAVSFALRAVGAALAKDAKATEFAEACLNWASQAAALWVCDSPAKLIGAVARDIDCLIHASGRQDWTEDTPFSPEVVGSLWPEGEPERWSAGGDGALRARLAVKPFFRSLQPNEAITLYEGPLSFRTSAGEWHGKGDVHFIWLPRPDVVFALHDVTPCEYVPALGNGTLATVPVGFSCKAAVSRLHHQVGEDGTTLEFEGYVAGCPTLGKDHRLSAVVFHLGNFHNYLRPWPQPSPPDYDIYRTTIEADGWRVRLQATEHVKELTAALAACAGCAFTHAGRAERVDGSTFDAIAIADLLDALFYFFSFARGQWSPALLPVGLDSQGNKVWERWDARQTSDWRFRHSWFPEQAPDCLANVFPGFMRRWKDPDWNQTLRVAIHWYIESNAQAGAIEGSLVLQQLAVELLSSRLFVEERGTYTEKAFKDVPAVEKMRLLLAEAGVSAAIPASLGDLAAHAQREGWPDGPQALTRLRNCITHPTGRNRQTLDQVSIAARSEAFNLALWYLELILLWLMEHRGDYVNRLSIRFAGQSETVPWVAPTSP